MLAFIETVNYQLIACHNLPETDPNKTQRVFSSINYSLEPSPIVSRLHVQSRQADAHQTSVLKYPTQALRIYKFTFNSSIPATNYYSQIS